MLVPLFTYAGLGLNLVVFAQSIAFAIILALLRAFCIFIATFLSGVAFRQPMKVNGTLWMTLISQAGFSLGLAGEIAHIFPGWGPQLQSVIISCVVVNQLAGPILCKQALKWADEAGKATKVKGHGGHGDHHPTSQALIVGKTSNSMALALNLLESNWAVTMLTASKKEAKLAKEEVNAFAKEPQQEEIADSDSTGNNSVHEVKLVFDAVPMNAEKQNDKVKRTVALEKLKNVQDDFEMQRSCVVHKYAKVFDAIDTCKTLKTIVLALEDDLDALALLQSIQKYLSTVSTTGICFVALVKHEKWAEAFYTLDAIPVHDVTALLLVLQSSSLGICEVADIKVRCQGLQKYLLGEAKDQAQVQALLSALRSKSTPETATVVTGKIEPEMEMDMDMDMGEGTPSKQKRSRFSHSNWCLPSVLPAFTADSASESKKLKKQVIKVDAVDASQV